MSRMASQFEGRVMVLLGVLAACSTAPAATSWHGTVRTQRFHSDSLGVSKDYLVYLPADYDTKPNARWPVFYYLHGLSGDETNWIHVGHLDRAGDQIALEAIVVMPDGDDGFYTDWVTPIDYDACMRDGTGLMNPTGQSRARTCVRQRSYETYITRDLIADVDRRFHTIAARDGRAIAGLSMGGFGALQLAMRHPDLYAAAASHSGVDALLYKGPHPYAAGKVELVTDPSTWGAGVVEIGRWVRPIFGPDLANWQAHDPASLVAKLEPGKLALYLDCGIEDGFALQDGAAYLHDLLLARKVDHAYFVGPGHHDFAFWSARVSESLKFLRDHTAHAR
jgi:S-formylglutathione hydrolase FrmB